MSFRTAALGALFSLSFVTAAGAEDAVAPDWSKAETVQIVMTEYAFSPQSLHLKHGVPYRLHFVNNGARGHDFSSAAFFAAVSIVPDDQAKVVDGAVDVEDGQATDVRVVAVKTGTYPVRCTHFTHAMRGMTGEAVIE